MLFNSSAFIFIYLPIVLTGFFVLGRASLFAASMWLAAASLIFYGWDDWRFLLPLISISIIFNFFVGRLLATRKFTSLLLIGICGNLCLLAWFKYAGFLAENLASAGISVTLPRIILPIGISFFTFTQIAFLVDAFRGEAKEYRFIHYVLFVSYFPHLIAGPILHHKEMMPQFAKAETYGFNLSSFARGLSWFAVGLFKKVFLADGIAPFSDAQFSLAEKGHLLSATDAWTGALSYSLQLYFDFSGYSDMAIGLALMMGIHFPFNFNSPYKASSIIDFWRRWHITLSRFLRDYLYFPLGGNRRGAARRYLNLMLTMVIGGLWHGASWNFVAWGAIHGAALSINNLWRDTGLRLPSFFARSATLLLVVLAWVPFRAQTMSEAVGVWSAMIGLNGMPGGYQTVDWSAAAWILGLAALAMFGPNTQEVFLGDRVKWKLVPAWNLSASWAIASGVLFGLSVAHMLVSPTTFLYFRF